MRTRWRPVYGDALIFLAYTILAGAAGAVINELARHG